jgi:hypothetical protein
MGGVTNLRAALRDVPPGTAVRGLCDAAEAPYVARVLGRDDLEAAGFGVCVADLEDELVRALGPDAVVDLVAAQGQLPAFRSLQQQPAQRHRPVDAQLRRFFGSGSGRKLRYARVLAEALPPDAVPVPLRVALGVGA